MNLEESELQNKIRTWLKQFVPRPINTIENLPAHYRWEFTRRHPYYQLFWDLVNPRYSSENVSDFIRDLAEKILACVNIGPETIPPETEWKELVSNGEAESFDIGVLKRIQIKGLVSTLIGVLPKDTLQSISTLLWKASLLEEGDIEAEESLLRSVAYGEFPGFDCYLPELIVTIFPSASEKSISEAVTKIVRNFRTEHDISAKRVRTDKFDSYLRVWDLREGWDSGAYVRAREHKILQVAKELKIPRATASDHYKSAFYLITGTEYSPDQWFNIVGNFKLSGYLCEGGRPISRRAGRTKSIAGHSESSLLPEGSFIERFVESGEDILSELERKELIDAVKSDMSITDIVEKFELSSEAECAIEAFRDHLDIDT